ncbi:MAG: sensor histidine kinase [Rudaea sp.]
MRSSLLIRLMGAFALVIVITLVVVSFIANQATAREFQYFMYRGQMVTEQELVQELAVYYESHGGWQGVETLLSRGGAGGMMGGGGMMRTDLALADARGVLVADSSGGPVGQTVDPAALAAGAPIQVGGRTVGTLLASSGMMSADPASRSFLDQVNRSLVLAALAAGLIALALGFLLFRQVTAPLHALASASSQLAAGDLRARVPVKGNDEIAEVGRAFNAMADDLARSEAARQAMLADIAHELRNPLGVIQSHLEAMLDGVFPAGPEQIASLHDETLLLTRLVGDLRELALAETGQLSLDRAPADLAALVSRVVTAFRPAAAEKGIELQSELDAITPPLQLDTHRVEQVLANLLSNALRYTPAGGAVKVKLGNTGAAARVEVSDSGPGISPDALPHVFERFWRGEKSSDQREGGVGLGLAIARRWIEAHGGRMGAESAVGQGSTFWFELPLPT